jgi:hypothetical protein
MDLVMQNLQIDRESDDTSSEEENEQSTEAAACSFSNSMFVFFNNVLFLHFKYGSIIPTYKSMIISEMSNLILARDEKQK